MGLVLGLGFGNFSGGFIPTPPLSSVGADGWQATVASPTDLSLTPFTVNRAGYNDAGTATTISDTLLLTKRVRQAFPNQASFTTDQVALSDYVYADDVIPGATNNSTETSPKPIATWGMIDRTLVGNSLAWEIIPFHRNARLGRQVACVQVQATDGTNTTAWQTVSTTSISTSCEGANAVEVYAGALDITALNNDATITLRGRVFPWFGVTASILDSNTETEFRFSNRFFYKNTTLASAPNLIYVASTGNDTTGVVSTNPATAKASPALTIGGAVNRLRAVIGSGGPNSLSGCEIRVSDGVSMGTVPFNTYRLDGAAIKVTRDPDVSRSTANITWATGQSFRLWQTSNTGAVTTENGIIFDDVTITRTADVTFLGEAARRMHAQLRNVDMNFSSVGAASGMMANSHVSVFGMTVTNYVGGFNYTTVGDFRILRGLSGSFNNAVITGYNIIGCSLAAARIDFAFCERGSIVYNNNLPSPPSGNPAIFLRAQTAGQNITFAMVQNLATTLSATGDAGIRISADSDAGNVVHGVRHHNSTPGDGIYGRWNLYYDDTAATARTHNLISDKGNLGPQLNTKGDVFMSNGTRTGNFAFHHGVGCAGNYTEDVDAGGGGLSFGQAYGGIGSKIANGDPLYVDDRAVSLPGPVAGSLGGNYTLQTGSPARDLFSEYLLAFDIAGNARPTSGTVDAGAYA